MPACIISTLTVTFSLSQSQASPYSMSGQRNVRALWANCKGEGRQNQVCVSQPVWYIQRKEPWNTKACWWVSRFSRVQAVVDIHHTSTPLDWPSLLSARVIFFQRCLALRLCFHSFTFVFVLLLDVWLKQICYAELDLPSGFMIKCARLCCVYSWQQVAQLWCSCHLPNS